MILMGGIMFQTEAWIDATAWGREDTLIGYALLCLGEDWQWWSVQINWPHVDRLRKPVRNPFRTKQEALDWAEAQGWDVCRG